MLLKFFPKTYKSISWQKTGLPISTNKTIKELYRYYRGGKSRSNRLFQKLGVPPIFKDTKSFADYNNWMRNNPKVRQYIYDMVLSPNALGREYFKPNYLKQIVEDHMSGKNNRAELIGLLLTFELVNRMFIDRERI